MHGHPRLNAAISSFFRALKRAPSPVALTAGILAMLALAACSGGGSNGSAGTSTGSVGILATDADTDQFCSIWVTINEVILLSDEGQVSIFEGSKDVDLLDLRDNTDLISVGRKVPARLYSKIRLVIDNKNVELVPCDDSPSIFADLNSGKIDLNPRGELRVRGGQLMLIRLDMDAEKSIHFTENDNAQFRPVIFVDILTANVPGRLVRLFGNITALNPDLSRFDLCDSHAVSRPSTDDDDERDSCVEIQVEEGTDNDTSIFLADAVPGGFGDLEEGAPALVFGHFLVDGEELRVSAEVVWQDPDPVDPVRGTVASEVIDDVFDLEIDPEVDPHPGIALTDDLIAVLLQEGTKIFTKDGEPLEASDLMVGQRARVFGALDPSEDDVHIDLEEHIHSTVIFVKGDEVIDPPDRTSGVFTSWDDLAREMTLNNAGVFECVSVPEEADVFFGSVVDDTIVFKEVDPSDFPVGVSVTAFGDDDDPCFDADTVIGFDSGVSID